jgi:hypothetical protein
MRRAPGQALSLLFWVTPGIEMSQFNDKKLEAIFLRLQTQQTGAPLEGAWERTTWRRILSGYNLDLGIAAVIYLFAVAAAIGVVVFSGVMHTQSGMGPGLQVIFGTAVFGTFIELLRRTYDSAIKRLATIDLFTSEILSIMRVIASANIIGDFVRLYDRLHTPSQITPGVTTNEPGTGPAGFADSARKEDYFTIFGNNVSDLASLDPAVVNDITAFYTFLKASRDATGALQLWRAPDYELSKKKDDIVGIVYLCFLMCVHGQLALDNLITSAVNGRIAHDIFAGVKLQCFSFLDHVVPRTDFRWPRIEQRRSKCDELRRTYNYAL